MASQTFHVCANAWLGNGQQISGLRVCSTWPLEMLSVREDFKLSKNKIKCAFDLYRSNGLAWVGNEKYKNIFDYFVDEMNMAQKSFSFLYTWPNKRKPPIFGSLFGTLPFPIIFKKFHKNLNEILAQMCCANCLTPHSTFFVGGSVIYIRTLVAHYVSNV